MWILTQSDNAVNMDIAVRVGIINYDTGCWSKIVAETDGTATVLGEYKRNRVDSVFESVVNAITGEYPANVYIMPQD